VLIAFISLHANAAQPAGVITGEHVRYLQSWFGAGDTDQPWELQAEDEGGPFERDVGTIPYLGGSAMYLAGEQFRYGWEAGGLIGWNSYDSAFASNGGDLRVAIDASLWSFEAFFGGVIAWEPRPGVRFYAAGGPALAFMNLDNEEEEAEVLPAGSPGPSGIFIRVDAEEDDASFMPYARAGFEILAGNGLSFGISARYAPHEFDFGTSGELEFDGVQWFVIVGARR
jgi:hypothetical protein